MTKKINKLSLIFPFLIWLMSYQVFAQNRDGIDQIYRNHSGITWGQAFNRIFSRSAFNKSYALVIGISHYDNFRDLATQKDAIRMKNFLLNEASFDEVHLITGNKVTQSRIRTIMLDNLPRKLGSNDRFLFYWSGHGLTYKANGQSFGYLPVSRSRSNQFSSMIDMRNLSSWDNRLKVKQSLYLLDACFSGLASYQAKSTQRNLTIEQIARPSRQILTAGLDNEEAIVIEGMGSLFTTAIIEGARGKADTASDGFRKDGIVSARELELYVKNRVGRERRRNNWQASITPLLTRFKHQPGDFFFYSKTAFRLQPPIPIDQTSKVVGKSVRPSTQVFKHYHNNRAHSHKLPNTGLHHRHGNGAWGTQQSSGIITQQQSAPRRNPRANQGKRIGQYIDHGNGTITDTKTGLMWKKCSEGQSGNNCSGKAREYTWKDAMRKFKRVSFAGYSDWRMPTIDELRTLVYCSNGTPQKEALWKGCNKDWSQTSDGKPAIRNNVFPNTPYLWSWYWSSSPGAGSVGSAWIVNFSNGNGHAYAKGGSNHVRLVRSGQ